MKDYVKTNGHACKCTTELPFCSPNDQQSLSLMEGHPSFIECSPIFPIYFPSFFICIFFCFYIHSLTHPFLAQKLYQMLCFWLCSRFLQFLFFSSVKDMTTITLNLQKRNQLSGRYYS
ncbi:hypothetical protein V6Z11_A05G090600 [Gossypium hirsutum]